MKKAFTLAEVLITLGIIGVVAAMTIPTLVQSYQEKQMVTGLQKFNSTLQQAVMMWKTDIDCTEDSYTCLLGQNLPDGGQTNFDQIAKHMRVVQKTTNPASVNWLPADTANYYGNIVAGSGGKVAKISGGNAYLLEDGTTFTMDTDAAGFDITVDVNGSKPPNRIGKDSFRFTLGELKGKDISYYAYWPNAGDNALGICAITYGQLCDSANVDPSVGRGASPTAYVIMNSKLPDFKALSQSVAGFKP